MSQGFLRSNRGSRAAELMAAGQRGVGHRAFCLLHEIAMRVRWREGVGYDDLEQGQCFIGTGERLAGLSRQQIRSALKLLEKCRTVTTTATNTGTRITLIDTDIFDPYPETATNTATSEQPTSNQRATTKNKVIREEGEKECSQPNGCSSHPADGDLPLQPDLLTEETTETPESKPTTKPPPTPYKEIVSAYNDALGQYLPGVTVRTTAREKAMQGLWRLLTADMSNVRNYFGLVAQSNFLTGRSAAQGKRPWRANFDWCCKPANIAKVIEGNYTD